MNIKLYTSAGIYIKTINPNQVKNKITFTDQINGGLGVLSLLLNLDDDFDFGQIVKIYQNEVLVYSGVIMNKKIIQTNIQELELECVGFASLLTYTIADDGGDYSYTINASISSALSTIIDKFNAKYNYLTKNIPTISGNINLEISGKSIFEVIKNITDNATGYFWHIDANGEFKIALKSNQTVHRLTLAKNIAEMTTDINGYDIFNKLVLVWNNGSEQVNIYSDSTSITTYGIREKCINNSSTKDITTANLFGTNFLEENKSPKNVSVITVFGDSENYKVGEYFNILNSSRDFGNMQIIKKQVNDDKTIFTLDKNYNFISIIKENGSTNN